MDVQSKVNGNDQIFSHVVTLANILQILAVPFVHTYNDQNGAALARESTVLRMLVDSRAGVVELRARALDAITIAERVVQTQLRALAHDGNTPSANSATQGWLPRWLGGDRHFGPPQVIARSVEELELARAGGERLLAKLAELRLSIADGVTA